MNFLEKLDFEMDSIGINKSKLSQLSGVPYTTIDGFYKRGYENAKISTIRKIAKTLGVSLDYLIEDDSNDETTKSPSLEDGDEELLKKFHQLNQYNRGRVSGYIDMLLEEAKSQEDSGCAAG